jgi:hypothetical protein
MATDTLTHEILIAALESFETQKKRLEESISQVRSLLNHKEPVAAAVTVAASSGKPGRRKLSAASRAKMAAAQRLRWSKVKGTASAAAPAAKPKAKRKLSAAGRRKISEAAKKRWAAIKAAA